MLGSFCLPGQRSRAWLGSTGPCAQPSMARLYRMFYVCERLVFTFGSTVKSAIRHRYRLA